MGGQGLGRGVKYTSKSAWAYPAMIHVGAAYNWRCLPLAKHVDFEVLLTRTC